MLNRILVVSLLCASLVLAQGGGRGGGNGARGGGPSGPGGMGFPMGPPLNKLDSIALVLSLNKEQKKTVRTILDDGAKQAAPLRDQFNKGRIALGEAIMAKKSEDELKQVVKTSSSLSAQLSQIEIKAFARIFGALDETQRKNMSGLGRVLELVNGIYHGKNWNED